MKTYGNTLPSKALVALLLVLALVMFGAGVAVAQDGEGGEAVAGADAGAQVTDPALPGWADQLAFGAVSLSAFVWAATELTKRALKFLGLYQDGWGRGIVVVWSVALVGAALAAEMFQAQGVVVARVEWLYQLMLLLLTLLGAPVVHKAAKATGLSDNNDDDPGDLENSIHISAYGESTATKLAGAIKVEPDEAPL